MLKWVGFTVTNGVRKAGIRRAHGNWLALVYDRQGRVSSGEYFPCGQPGSLQLAKQWCENRLVKRSRNL